MNQKYTYKECKFYQKKKKKNSHSELKFTDYYNRNNINSLIIY